MPRTVPKTIDGKLETFRLLLARWAADPAGVGLTPGEVDALAAALAEAEAADRAAEAARQAAERATMLRAEAVGALAGLGARLIARVRGAAAVSGDRAGTLVRAGLAPPSGPTFTDAPPPRAWLTLSPTPGGEVALAWRADLKRTDYYRIERRVAGPGRETPANGAFTLLAAVRGGRFVDAGLPVGFTRAEYRVTPVRERRGGHGAGGGTIEGPASGAGYTPGTVWGGGAAAAA
jgi:hypothetical protein